jgi:hypothetical protein
MSTNNPKNDQHHRELISSTLGDAIKIALYTQAGATDKDTTLATYNAAPLLRSFLTS